MSRRLTLLTMKSISTTGIHLYFRECAASGPSTVFKNFPFWSRRQTIISGSVSQQLSGLLHGERESVFLLNLLYILRSDERPENVECSEVSFYSIRNSQNAIMELVNEQFADGDGNTLHRWRWEWGPVLCLDLIESESGTVSA